jgi:uncharacterized protein
MLEPYRQRLQEEGSVDLMIRVRPHAARTELTSILEDGSMKIAVAAPADEGRGNAMLISFLADQFGVPASAVKILSGKTARLKLVRVTAP